MAWCYEGLIFLRLCPPLPPPLPPPAGCCWRVRVLLPHQDVLPSACAPSRAQLILLLPLPLLLQMLPALLPMPLLVLLLPLLPPLWLLLLLLPLLLPPRPSAWLPRLITFVISPPQSPRWNGIACCARKVACDYRPPPASAFPMPWSPSWLIATGTNFFPCAQMALCPHTVLSSPWSSRLRRAAAAGRRCLHLRRCRLDLRCCCWQRPEKGSTASLLRCAHRDRATAAVRQPQLQPYRLLRGDIPNTD